MLFNLSAAFDQTLEFLPLLSSITPILPVLFFWQNLFLWLFLFLSLNQKVFLGTFTLPNFLSWQSFSMLKFQCTCTWVIPKSVNTHSWTSSSSHRSPRSSSNLPATPGPPTCSHQRSPPAALLHSSCVTLTMAVTAWIPGFHDSSRFSQSIRGPWLLSRSSLSEARFQSCHSPT